MKTYNVTYAKSNSRDAQRYKMTVKAKSKQHVKDIIIYEKKIFSAQNFKFV